MRCWWRRQEGQATLEAAMILPLLLLILLGMVGVALILHTSTMAVLAANRGARVGAVAYGDSTLTPEEQRLRVTQAANSMLGTGLSGVNCSIDIEPTETDLSVTVSCQKPIRLPLITQLLGSANWTAQHTATYRIESH